jgi:curved DNA-binding protein
MDVINYYKVMGVTDHASQATIKLAYRKLARKFHPDVSKETDADDQFRALGDAYAVLKDAKKRTVYDQIRALRTAEGRRRRKEHGAETSSVVAGRQFREFSKAVFGTGMAGGKHRPPVDHGSGASISHRGPDLHHRLALTLEEAVQGVQRTLKLDMPIETSHREPHAQCKVLNVTIPAGVVHGQRIRLVGQGGPGFNGGLKGDYYLEIELAPHPLFAVAGRDILLTLPVANWEVALGARVEVPTLAGTVRLTIQKGLVSGKKLRLKGRGLGLDPTGDLIINLHVMVPERHWTKAEALYREVAAL